MVAFVGEMTAKKSWEDDGYRSFEHLLFLFSKIAGEILSGDNIR